VRQTIAARKLLADDPDLAAWNIGVIVTNRVAKLWGPAPSAEIAFRAEVRLRSMIALADVKNELFVSELLEPMRVPMQIDQPPRTLPDVLPPRPPIKASALAEIPKTVVREQVRPEPMPPTPIQVLPPEALPEPETYSKKLPR
jgi:hypothetical protein